MILFGIRLAFFGKMLYSKYVCAETIGDFGFVLQANEQAYLPEAYGDKIWIAKNLRG